MTARDYFSAADQSCGIYRGLVSKIWIKRIVRISVRIQSHQSVESLIIVRCEPAGEENLSVRLDENVPPPAIQSRAHVKTRIATAVRIQSREALAGRAIVIAKVSSNENSAVRLNRVPKNKRVHVAVNPAGNDDRCA